MAPGARASPNGATVNRNGNMASVKSQRDDRNATGVGTAAPLGLAGFLRH